MSFLDCQALNLVPHGTNLACKLAGIIAGDAGSNDRAAQAHSTSKVHLAAHVHVRDALVFAQ